MFFDLPREQLIHYRPPRVEPADFDAFWDATLAEVRQYPLDARFEPVDAGLRLVQVSDLRRAQADARLSLQPTRRRPDG